TPPPDPLHTPGPGEPMRYRPLGSGRSIAETPYGRNDHRTNGRNHTAAEIEGIQGQLVYEDRRRGAGDDIVLGTERHAVRAVTFADRAARNHRLFNGWIGRITMVHVRPLVECPVDGYGPRWTRPSRSVRHLNLEYIAGLELPARSKFDDDRGAFVRRS